MTKDLVLDIIGWLSISAILLGYILITFQVLIPNSLAYQSINLLGSVGIVFSSLAKKNYQIVVLNIIWFGAALIGIINVVSK
jgi:hypothetical protein